MNIEPFAELHKFVREFSERKDVHPQLLSMSLAILAGEALNGIGLDETKRDGTLSINVDCMRTAATMTEGQILTITSLPGEVMQ